MATVITGNPASDAARPDRPDRQVGPGDFSLNDKYDREAGLIYLTGIQALVRLPMDQHRADARRGLHTATFISGYRGSPLGGFDSELERQRQRCDQFDIVHQPGLNEELAATAVFGSQLANTRPGARYDGVLGMWYGKGPGVDRTGDAFKHANLAGVGPTGGVLALATHVGNAVEHPGELWGEPTDLDFVLHDRDAVLAAAGAAGLTDLEWYVRSPLPIEAQTQRLYLRGYRAT